MARRWTTLTGLNELTRQEILDANDWLEAIDEAEARQAEKARLKK